MSMKMKIISLLIFAASAVLSSVASAQELKPDAPDRYTVQRGDTVLLEGVGGGFTWGSVLLRY